MTPLVYRERIPETIVEGKRLGRHIRRDPRDRRYPAELAPRLMTIRHASSGMPLDQAQVASCTGEACVGCLNTVPHWEKGQSARTQNDAYHVYSVETKMEGQPWPPNDPGGTGQDVCDAALKLGWIVAYQHAYGLQQVLLALVPRPVMVGISWYDSFDTPSSAGLISMASGAVIRGGHELVLDEIDLANKLVGGWQSWGSLYWPAGGRIYIPFSLLGELQEQGGDCTVPRTGRKA